MDNLAATTAVVLAGGVGSRLRSVVGNRPKALASIHNRPFLAYLLDALEAAGIGEVVLCTGYMAEQVEETFGPTYGRMQFRYSRESTPLGTGGALRAAMPWIKTDFVLVMNGDSFCEVDLRRHGRRAPRPAGRSHDPLDRGSRYKTLWSGADR